MHMDHHSNSFACFYKKGDCIFEAKNDGYIGNDFCLDLWILCQLPPDISFVRESRGDTTLFCDLVELCHQ